MRGTKSSTTGGIVAGVILVCGVVGIAITAKRKLGKDQKDYPKIGPQSGVTTNPTNHLKGLNEKRDSTRTVVGKAKQDSQEKPPVGKTKHDSQDKPPAGKTKTPQTSVDDEVWQGTNPDFVKTPKPQAKEPAALGKRESTRTKKSPAHRQESQVPPLPDHVVLVKDKELRAKAKDLAGKTGALDAEYRSLLDYVKKNINKPKTVAKLDENRDHNRYIDIGT